MRLVTNIPEKQYKIYYKICFAIDEETDAKVKQLPRSFNLSEQLRLALVEILKERELVV